MLKPIYETRLRVIDPISAGLSLFTLFRVLNSPLKDCQSIIHSHTCLLWSVAVF